MLEQLFGRIYNQIVTIPIDNNLGLLYVLLNFVMTLLAPFLDTGE